MRFLDRSSEMKRLDKLMTTGDGGMAHNYSKISKGTKGNMGGRTRALLKEKYQLHFCFR